MRDPDATDPDCAARHLAAVIGPTLLALAGTEAVHLDTLLAGGRTARVSVVQLNGLVLFVAGLGVLRAHGRWTLRWPGLVTLAGWTALLTGFGRMAFPLAGAAAAPAGLMLAGIPGALGLVGAVLSWQGWIAGQR